MNKKKILIAIIVSFAFVVGIIGSYYGVVTYLSSAKYWINSYQKEPSTENLVYLCDFLYSYNDIKYLNYIDTLISDPNAETCYVNIHPDIEKDLYYNMSVAGTFRVCAQNNDIDKFCDSMPIYYKLLRAEKKFEIFYYSLDDCNNFVIFNQERIINSFINIYKTETDPYSKMEILTAILGYYNSVTVNDYEKKEYFSNEFNEKKVEMGLTKEEQLKYQELYLSSLSYWDLLLDKTQEHNQ